MGVVCLCIGDWILIAQTKILTTGTRSRQEGIFAVQHVLIMHSA